MGDMSVVSEEAQEEKQEKMPVPDWFQ